MSDAEEYDTETYRHLKIVESLRYDPRNDLEEGTQTVHYGRDADPDYTVLTEDGVRLITHETVEVLEAPKPMPKDELLEWAKGEWFGDE